MSITRFFSFLISSWCLSVATGAFAETDADARAAQAAVLSFHDALRRGDVEAVKQLLAPDAVILENGQVESRDEYLRHHLGADMEFAKAVPPRTTESQATVSGRTAWVRSSTTTEGKFHDRVIKLKGAELVVLTRSPAGWKIRAIHWSSHEVK